MRGGYRIKTELRMDLEAVRQHAEVIKSIAELEDGINKNDERDLVSNSDKIKTLINRWI